MSGFGRLRHFAEVNPASAAFDALPANELVTFMPLEAVWPNGRRDTSRLRPKSEVDTGYVRFEPGDVLSPKVTPTFEAGRTTYIDGLDTRAGAASTEVHVVRAWKGRADPRFIAYVLLSKPFLDGGVSHFQGVAGLQRVPADYLKDFPILDASLVRQRRIADFLDDQVGRIDNIIAAREKQISLAEQGLLSRLGICQVK